MKKRKLRNQSPDELEIKVKIGVRMALNIRRLWKFLFTKS